MKLSVFSIDIIQKLNSNSFDAYIIGGSVRNYLLGYEYTDIDIATNAKPNEIIKIFKDYKIDQQGIAYGSLRIISNHEDIQITTFRNESDYHDQRHPKKIIFLNTLQDDVLRRDFTINAIAYHPIFGFFDHVNGLQDIYNKKIKLIGNAQKRILEDPLRILRAIRFCCCYHLELEDATFAALHENTHMLSTIPIATYTHEVQEILNSTYLIKFIRKYSKLFFSILGIENSDEKRHHLFLLSVENSCEDNIIIHTALLYFFKNDLLHQTKWKLSNKFTHSTKQLLNILSIMEEKNNNPNKLLQLLKYNKSDVHTTYTFYKSLYNKQHINLLENFIFLEDLNINARQLIQLGITPGKQIKMILDDIIVKVNTNELPNSINELEKYVKLNYI